MTEPRSLLHVRYEHALRLLAEVAREAESLQKHIAVHGEGACNGIRTRVQNIHGLAVTPEVDGWDAE